jgi:hypothetical protein
MRKAAALVTAGLVLAGCSSTVSGAASPAGPDGRQTYASVQDLYDDIVEGGTTCENLEPQADNNPGAELASCELGGGDQLVLAVWQSAGGRNAGLSQIQGALDDLDLDYCFVVGRGDSGTWSVNAGDAPEVCQQIGSDLGGQVDKSGT